MIEISNVLPTPRELRLVYGAWPAARAWSYVVRGWAIALLLLLMGLAWTFSGPGAALWVEAWLFALVFGQLALGLMANRHIDRLSRATPLGGAASRWVLDANSVRIVSPLGEQSIDWRGIVEVVEERDRLLFAATPARTHVLPTRCLGPDQLAAVKALIAELRATGRLGAGVDYPPPASDKA